jgi:hypothetical protein
VIIGVTAPLTGRKAAVQDYVRPRSPVASAGATGGATMSGQSTRQVDRRTVLKAGMAAVLASPLAGYLATPARAAAADPAVVGSWAAPFNMGGVAIHATLTRVDDVLFYQYVEGSPTVDHTSYVATWNYRTGATAEAGLPYDRDVFCASQGVLPDGRVFIAGGHDHTTGNKQDAVGVTNTDIYNPANRTWTATAPLTQKRWYPTVVGLPNGRALVFGGQAAAGVPANTVEEYDPVTNTMRTLPPTATKPVGLYPRMHMLPNGKVIKAGPEKMSAYFNPATSAWSNVANMLYGNRGRGCTALLPGATRVLAVGGRKSATAPATGTAELLDTSVATPAWRSTGSLTYPRLVANLVTLPDGQVLIVGGGAQYKYTNPVKIPELYNPVSGTWTPMAPQQAGRMYHSTAVLLPDGRVLSAGQDSGPLATYGEIFSPPYLFRGARPSITASPASIGYRQALNISTPDAGTISRVTVIKAGAATHEINSDQRSIPLTFAAAGGTITAQSPANANVAPPGYYLLFIVNINGVPSVAPWLRIG